MLAHLVGNLSDYAKFSTDYYETDVDEHLVADVFAHQSITAATIASLNPSATLQELSEELYGEIQYPNVA